MVFESDIGMPVFSEPAWK